MDLAQRLLFIKDNMNELLREVMEENEDLQELVIQMNRDQLKEQGIDSTGEKLGSYAASTARLRAQAGLQTSYIDLSESGDFQEDFIIEDATGDVIFHINSKNWKRNILVERLGNRPGFGEDIFGLTEENLEILREKMAPRIKDKINRILNA